MIYSDSFIKIFTDVRDLYDLEHSLVSLLRFLFISRLLFLYTFSIWALVLSFNFYAQMRESTHFQVSQESFSRFVGPTMLFPLWHAHSSMDILSLISILHFWSVQSAMSALFHVLLTQASMLSPFSLLSLFFVFAKLSNGNLYQH